MNDKIITVIISHSISNNRSIHNDNNDDNENQKLVIA